MVLCRCSDIDYLMAGEGADHLGAVGGALVYLRGLEGDIVRCSSMMELITFEQVQHGKL